MHSIKPLRWQAGGCPTRRSPEKRKSGRFNVFEFSNRQGVPAAQY